jgi:AcrR family transcriptional regulator
VPARVGSGSRPVQKHGHGEVVQPTAGEPRSELADQSLPRTQVVEIQRARLLAAAVRAVEELGYTRVTVAHITRRARVSRRTFYELFSNREECLLAVIDETLERIDRELIAAAVDDLAWCGRIRVGLGVILSFFDREPALARMCVVQAMRGGPAVLERREQILARLATAIDGGRAEGPRGERCTPLIAEGLVGAAFAIVHTRLLRDERVPLAALLGELMGMIVLPYLGPAATRRELTRPAPDVSPQLTARKQFTVDPLEGLSMRMTYRTAKVLEGIAQRPGVSNREVARHAGIHDQGQVSKLLSRLQRLGLLVNQGPGHIKGEPNSWCLTPSGVLLMRSIALRQSSPHEGQRV